MNDKHITIHTYDTEKYDFKKFFEDKLNLKLEEVHQHIELEYKNNAMHHTDTSIYDELYSYIRSDEFGEIWEGFIEEYIKPILNSKKIVLQQLPSIKIHPPKYKGNFLARDNNFHTDGDMYWHPNFERNFWLPLINTDEWNTLWVEEDGETQPQVLSYGEFIKFDGQSRSHGTINNNKSNHTRISLDFRGCAIKDFDETILTDEVMTSKKVPIKQKDWFSIGNYYEIF